MNRETVYLAALLHDVGKFWQRADESGTAKSAVLSPSIKALEGMYCPQYNGFYSHKHILWTAQFFAEHEMFYKSLLGTDYAACFEASVAHHNPNTSNYFQKLIQKADHYASGIDRTGESGIRDAAAENRWDSFKNVRMVSIFETILREPKDLKPVYEIPISQIKVNKSVFPDKKFTTPGQPEYQKIWAQFDIAVKNLHNQKFDSIDAYCDSMTYLLHRFAASVPSSTQELPDVSLYDHLKITAAFAVCLDAYIEEKNNRTDWKIAPNESPVLLVGGDFSGIQNYIYDIVSSDAAKNLKGRSFYLQMLGDNIVRRLLNKLGLPQGCIIYSSGGGFFLLAPNTAKTRDIIAVERKEIAQKLFEEHKTGIFLGLDWVEVTDYAIMNRKIGECWKALMEKLGFSKRNKFKDALIERFGDFFEPIEVGGVQKRDTITNEELTEKETLAVEAEKERFGITYLDDDPTKPIKFSTKQQIDLGRQLKNTVAWIISDQYIPTLDRKDKFEFCKLGVFNYLLDKSDLLRKPSFDNATVLLMQHTEESAQLIEHIGGRNIVKGFTFYGGNDYPRWEAAQSEEDKKLPAPFDELARSEAGADKLGILRMDVDNLGFIFKNGLPENKKTFSRYSTLSRGLDYFFRGYLNHIWDTGQLTLKQGDSQQVYAFKDKSYILYSGGDDLFIVGHWNILTAFAKQIRDDFKEYTCGNPNLSLSGGLAIVPPKFPISKGANFADEAEKSAKAYTIKDLQEKNAFALLGTPLNWEKDYPLVVLLKTQLGDLLDQKKLPQGILHKLMSYAAIADDQRTRKLNESWRWHMAYDFARAKERAKDDQARDFYDQVRQASYTEYWNNQSIQSSHQFLNLLATAARWVELEKR